MEQARLKPYMNAISLKVDANGISLDFTAMDAMLGAKKLANPHNAFTDLMELNKYTGDKLNSSGWDSVERIIEWTADLEANNIDVNALLTEFGYRTPTVGNDNLFGLSGSDTLNGGDGNDVMYGGLRNDSIDGGNGNDSLNGAGGNDIITGNGQLEGGLGDGKDSILEYGSNDPYYVANYGNKDMLKFGAGILPADVARIRVGNDLVFKVSASDQVTMKDWFVSSDRYIEEIQFADGTVWNQSTVQTNILNPTNGTALDNILNGSINIDAINGLAGNDVINGLAGNDFVEGDQGDDTLSGGDDRLFGGLGADQINGDFGNDKLYGGDGNDRLDGGTGADTLAGGIGNDTYVVDDAADIVTENANEGTDTVESSVNLDLSNNINLENLTLTGTAAVNGTGNSRNNRLVGNTANNTLDGKTGADTLVGGLGNDTYVVDNVLDAVTEYLNEGTDLVRSDVTYTLGDNLENLTLTGSAAINGTGNSLNNVLTGSSAANIMAGGTGNDRLAGGAGADTMIGGIGNDVYVADNIADIVTENLDEGIDTVESSIAFDLSVPVNVENLTLTGSTAINGTGNALDNVLTGNSGVNTLNGGAGNDRLMGGTGADTMLGGIGNDTYVVDVATDVVTENADEGIDTMETGLTYTLGTNIENLTITGTAARNGTDNGLNNNLVGNGAGNTLDGGVGNDTLTGGAGADSFMFSTALDALLNKDTITDFSVIDDTIRLENAIFTKYTATGAINASSFVSGLGAVALDSNDYLVYDTTNGSLYYDADGNGAGAQVEIVTLTGIPPITASDFAIV